MNDKINTKAALQFLCLAMLISLPIQVQAEKIVYVDARRLITEAPQGQDEIRILEEKFGNRNRDLQSKIVSFKAQEADLQKNSLTLSTTERVKKTDVLVELQRILQRDQKNYSEDYERSQSQGLVRLEKLISDVIIDLAKKESIDLVVQQVVYASPKIDFTDRVLKELKSRHENK